MSKSWGLIFFWVYTFSFSQDIESEVWSKIEYNYKVNKKNSISLESGARYTMSPVLFSKQFLDFSSSYKISNSLSIENGIRLTKVPDQKLLGKRLYVTIFYKPDLGRLKFSWRSRFFTEKHVVSYNRQYFRNKISVGYKFRDIFNPYFDFEYLYGMNDLSQNKSRFGIGNQFQFSKSIGLKIFFRMQNKDKRIFGIYISKKF